jgi:hypothetical protein
LKMMTKAKLFVDWLFCCFDDLMIFWSNVMNNEQ